MGRDSAIQWTENTWNPWHGCHKVSPGCKYCYMYRDKDRYGQDPTSVLRSKKFDAPLHWPEPKMVFTCSWSDWFIEEADPWRDEAWKIIKDTPRHTYQILTKRPHLIRDRLPEDWGDGYDNVWLGVSIENNDPVIRDERVNALCDIPASIRFVSAEPLLDYIGFDDGVVLSHNFENYIDWVIVGGESGNNTGKWRYRRCELGWIEEILLHCKYYDIPVFVKQLGTYLAKELRLKDRHGGDINEWPEPFQVREMPSLKNKLS